MAPKVKVSKKRVNEVYKKILPWYVKNVNPRDTRANIYNDAYKTAQTWAAGELKYPNHYNNDNLNNFMNNPTKFAASGISNVANRVYQNVQNIKLALQGVNDEASFTFEPVKLIQDYHNSPYVNSYDLINGIMRPDKRYVITLYTDDGRAIYLPMNAKQLGVLRELGSGNDDFSGAYSMVGVSGDAVEQVTKYIRFSISKRANVKSDKAARVGAYFGYTHNTHLDLKRYQIYTPSDEISDMSCLVYAISMSGINVSLGNVNKNIGDVINSAIRSRYTSTRVITEIANMYNLKFNIKNINDDLTIGKYRYVSPTTTTQTIATVNLCLFKEHYFIDEYTKYTLNDLVANRRDSENLVANRRDSENLVANRRDSENLVANTGSSAMKSSDLIIHMWQYGYFTPIDSNKLFNTPYMSNISNDVDIIIDGNCRPIVEDGFNGEDLAIKFIDPANIVKSFSDHSDEFLPITKANGETSPITLIFFDIETIVNDDNGDRTADLIHTPYMLSYCVTSSQSCDDSPNDSEPVNLCGFDCIDKFIYVLREIPEITAVISHNLSYDISPILQSQYVSVVNLIRDGSRIKCADLRINKKTVKFIDSLNYLAMPLKDIPKEFGIKDVEKEYMNYSVYTKQNINARLYDFDAFCDGANGPINTKWNYGGKIDIIDYAAFYCNQDVRILATAYNRFRSQMKALFNLDMMDYLTISSYAFSFLKINGAFDGVYEVKNSLLHFINRSCIGGRCQISNNIPHATNNKLVDYDGVSLYPSAIAISTIPVGKPKMLNPDGMTIDDINKLDYYIIEVTNMKFSKHYDLSTLPRRVAGKSLEWTNHFNPSDKFVLNKTYINELIKHNHATFDIIRGIYWDEGYNTRMNDIIKYMFNVRIAFKAAKLKSLANITKLMLNSAYGRTMLAPIDEKYIFIHGKDLNETKEVMYQYICNHSEFIKSAYLLSDTNACIKKISPIDVSYNSVHVASEILARSKSIVFKVSCLDSARGKIHYTDTDSFVLDKECLDDIRREYFEIYGTVLDGDKLGQFHVDTSMTYGIADTTYEVPQSEIYSIDSVFISKKIYYMKLTAPSDVIEKAVKGHKVPHYHDHFRMKGVASCVIENHPQYINNISGLYHDLLNKKHIPMDISTHKPTFKLTNDFKYVNVKMSRTIGI